MKIREIRLIKDDYKRKWKLAKSKESQSYNYNRYMHTHQMLKLGGVKVED